MNPVILATRTTSTGVLIEISANSSMMLGRANGGEWQQVGRIIQQGVIGGKFGTYAVLMTEIVLAQAEMARFKVAEITPEIQAERDAMRVREARENRMAALSANMDRADSVN